MNTVVRVLIGLFSILTMLSCETAEEAFIGDRINNVCVDAYVVCHRPTGCVLDSDHYVEGVFPGMRRVVIETEEPDIKLSVRMFFSTTQSPGTELLIQLKEPNCIVDIYHGREHMQDVDLFHEAGDDRTLMFELFSGREGEHLLEIYSDAAAEYLLIVEPI
jgi:hypothetical protein